jgi:hypothetical protein
VSFMTVLVTMMMSSAELASSLMASSTICRRLASLFWNSFEMPKNSVVASLVGNFSPVYSRSAILVRRIRHFRGWIGELLNSRAVVVEMSFVSQPRTKPKQPGRCGFLN